MTGAMRGDEAPPLSRGPSADQSSPAAWDFGDWVRRYLEHAPLAVAVVRGPAHTLVHANPAFRRLAMLEEGGAGQSGRPITEAFAPDVAHELAALLDRVLRDVMVARDAIISPADGSAVSWRCTVWPMMGHGGEPAQLVLEMREVGDEELMHPRQTAIAERLLLSALRDQVLAEEADASRHRWAFLAEADGRLGASLDQATTYATIAALTLPRPGAWSVVDVVDANGGLHRLAIVHPDPAKQALALQLDGHWPAQPDDPFGVPLARRAGRATVIAENGDTILATGARGAETVRLLRELGAGSLLVVPLVARGTLRGAITFVSRPDDAPYSDEDVRLAEQLADRCAAALDSSRLYEVAGAARAAAEAAQRAAEAANQAKSQFLAVMSHELRTPLNAIGGYTQLLEMGLRGPVTEEQHTDLTRIQRSQEHLLRLINTVLNFAKLESGSLQFDVADVEIDAAIRSLETLISPQLVAKKLAYQHEPCDEAAAVFARADPDKLQQILINLLTNALKFTGPAGAITVRCEARPDSVAVHVRDSGRGIPAERLDTIFDPFVQVGRRLTSTEHGVGLGLAISRDLARGMGGDLTVESEVDVGSLFTLTLPRAYGL